MDGTYAVRIGSSNPNCSAVSHSLWHMEFLSLSHSVEVGGMKWPDLLHKPNKYWQRNGNTSLLQSSLALIACKTSFNCFNVLSSSLIILILFPVSQGQESIRTLSNAE